MRFRRFVAGSMIGGLALLAGCPYGEGFEGVADPNFSMYTDGSADFYGESELTSLDPNYGSWDYGTPDYGTWDYGWYDWTLPSDEIVLPVEDEPFDILDLKSGKIRR